MTTAKQRMKDTGGRKILVSIFLTKDEMKYLDRKIKKSDLDRKSRGALIRHLVKEAMEHNLL